MTSDPLIVPLHLADVSFPEGHPLAGGTGPVLGFAVRHDDGVLLFDTGIGVGHAEVEQFYRPRVTPLDDALAANGLAMADVTALANSHLHFDHCGGNTRFPGLMAYVQAGELEATRQEDYTVQEWIGHGALRFVPLEADAETEVAPGVVLMATPGHTPGHQSCVVATPAGPVVSPARPYTAPPNGTARRIRRIPAFPGRTTCSPIRNRSTASDGWTRSACTSRTTRRSGHRRIAEADVGWRSRPKRDTPLTFGAPGAENVHERIDVGRRHGAGSALEERCGGPGGARRSDL